MNTIKDGEIEAITLTIEDKKYAIVRIHGEPKKEKEKEKFFKKVENIIKNNIKDECRILMGGDANSVWEDGDTTNEDKKELDKSIREFCKRGGWTDIS